LPTLRRIALEAVERWPKLNEITLDEVEEVNDILEKVGLPLITPNFNARIQHQNDADHEASLGWNSSFSTRAKWRPSPSACRRVLKQPLTPPTLSEMRFNIN